MRLFHQGDRGEPVLDIQTRLDALGYVADGDEPGVFGDATRKAVADFQRSRGLPVDGIIGADSWRSLVDAGYRLGERLLYHRVPMMSGDDVAELQARLNALGFDADKVDGIFGPKTLSGLLDFQHNRGLAEDGIAGDLVATELRLVGGTSQKLGREAVRERQWLQALPDSIAGQHVYFDPDCRSQDEATSTWAAAIAAAASVRYVGGRPTLSRSVDTTPDATVRSQRANRLNVDIVVGFSVPLDRDEGVLYFRSEHSRSEAGMAIATAVANRLDLPTAGRTSTILKTTRSPAIVVSLTEMNHTVGTRVAEVIASLYAERVLSQPEGSNK